MIHPGVYSSTIYEMEVWSLPDSNNYSDEEYQEQLQEDGRMNCGLRLEGVGLFDTRERALEKLEMMCEDPWGDDRELFCAFIREKAMYCMMHQADYLKEWTYVYCWLHDESIVRNYDEERNPFPGRPEGMTKFQVGDIVMVPDGYSGHWGIVAGTPLTEQKVKEINGRFQRLYEEMTGQPCDVPSILDWSDDSYLILTTGEGPDCAHEHIPAHHILPANNVPPFVRQTLEEGLRKASCQQPEAS